jgi:hypothetical protein
VTSGGPTAGPTRGEGKQAGSKRNIDFFIYSNNFQMSSNCFDPKVDIPSSKNFK